MERGAEKERETFPVPHTGNGSKDSQLLFLGLEFEGLINNFCFSYPSAKPLEN
jgi:hypothetical protein